MSISYSNTNNDINFDHSFKHQEKGMIKETGNFRNLMKIILISAIVLTVVSGIVLLAVVISKKKHFEDNGKHINYIDENKNVTFKTDNVDVSSTNVEESTEINIKYYSTINIEVNNSNEIKETIEDYVEESLNIKTDEDNSEIYIEKQNEINITDIPTLEMDKDDNSNYIEKSNNINNSILKNNSEINSTYIDEIKEFEIIDNSISEKYNDDNSTNFIEEFENINISNLEIINDINSINIEKDIEIINNSTIEINNNIDSTYMESEIINNSTIETNNDDNFIYVSPKETNIEYNEAELKFFNIEKNISSKIIGESNETQANITFNYISVLGIKNENIEENTNKTYYEGFCAILSTSYFNKSNNEEESLLNNIELNKIINEDNQNKLIRNLEKQYFKNKKNDEVDKEDYEETMPFLKISFYKDGTYKNINRPYSLSENNFKEMKEFLDLIIPKITNDSIFVKKIDQEIIEKVREDIQISNSLNDDNAFRNLNEKKISII